MFPITKTIFRSAVIGGLAVGGLTLLVGPERVLAGVSQVRYTVVSWFDDQVPDPVVMRHQLAKLQAEYPQKIRELTKSLAQVDAEIAQLRHDSEQAQRVVEISSDDLTRLAGLVDKANVTLASSNGKPVLVRFDGRHLNLDQAYDTASRIKQTIMVYQDRLAANQRDLGLLSTQRDRLSEQLEKLKNEYASFQAQVWQIERQIASIERNEDLIEMLEEQSETAESIDRWNIDTLDQLQGKLAAVQTEHEAILQTLTERVDSQSYEDRVRGKAALAEAMEEFDWSIPTPTEYKPLPEAPIVIDEDDVEEPEKKMVNAGDPSN